MDYSNCMLFLYFMLKQLISFKLYKKKKKKGKKASSYLKIKVKLKFSTLLCNIAVFYKA